MLRAPCRRSRPAGSPAAPTVFTASFSAAGDRLRPQGAPPYLWAGGRHLSARAVGFAVLVPDRIRVGFAVLVPVPPAIVVVRTQPRKCGEDVMATTKMRGIQQPTGLETGGGRFRAAGTGKEGFDSTFSMIFPASASRSGWIRPGGATEQGKVEGRGGGIGLAEVEPSCRSCDLGESYDEMLLPPEPQDVDAASVVAAAGSNGVVVAGGAAPPPSSNSSSGDSKRGRVRRRVVEYAGERGYGRGAGSGCIRPEAGGHRKRRKTSQMGRWLRNRAIGGDRADERCRRPCLPSLASSRVCLLVPTAPFSFSLFLRRMMKVTR